MNETSLADKLRELSSVKLKKAIIKVPKLDAGKEKVVKQKDDKQKKPNVHISSTLSSVVNVLIKTIAQKVKKSKKSKQAAEEKPYKIVKDDKSLSMNEGYATVSKGYETAPAASYVDYKKLFGSLGWFRAKDRYEHSDEEHVARANKSLEDSRFTILNSETLDRVTYYIKNFRGGYIDTLSLVPKAGTNSAEWEELRLMAKVDPVLYGFKTGRLLR